MYYIYIYTDISYRLEEWITLEFKNWRPSPAVRPWFLFFSGPGQGVEVPALGGGEVIFPMGRKPDVIGDLPIFPKARKLWKVT